MEIIILIIVAVLCYFIIKLLKNIRDTNQETKNLLIDYTQIKKTLSSKDEELKELKKKIAENKTESYEVKDLLRDLAGGRGLVKLTRVDPADFFLRSPRDRE
jgi:peptidoglycan hydrolase CwlO-like protein